MKDPIEVETAQFEFSFLPGSAPDRFASVFGQDTLEWHIDKALISVGEIGIHWSWYSTLGKAAATNDVQRVAHDIPGGKISPKIYEYFAVNLLDSTTLQILKVEPALYDHIHMIMKPSDSGTIGAETYPELYGHTYYFSGNVSHNGTAHPFVLYSDTTLKENELGDITFELRVYENDSYELNVLPIFDAWFNDIHWNDLVVNQGDTIVIADGNENAAAAYNFFNRLTFDNAFGFSAHRRN